MINNICIGCINVIGCFRFEMGVVLELTAEAEFASFVYIKYMLNLATSQLIKIGIIMLLVQL